MKFDDLHKIFKEKFKTGRLADISKELGVTPQVVSNWKSRNHIPYKYVKKLREIEKVLEAPSHSFDADVAPILYEDAGDTKTLIEIINLYREVMKRKKIFFTSISIIIVFSFLYLKFFYVSTYTSTGTIIQATEGNEKSKIGGLASQFGISMSSGSSGILSREVYPSIIKSYNFLYEMLLKDHKYKKFENIKLINIMMGADTTSRNWENFEKLIAVQKLSSKIMVLVDRKTSLIDIRVTTNDPILSRDIAKNIISELDLSLKKFEENQLTEKLEYISIRIDEVSKELEKAEENLKGFREKNRRISSSPLLLLEEDRLIREVDVQVEIFTTLKTQLELTQVELINRSNTILTIDTPRMPLHQTNSKPSRVFIFCFIIGLFISVFVAIIPDWIKNNMLDS